MKYMHIYNLIVRFFTLYATLAPDGRRIYLVDRACCKLINFGLFCIFSIIFQVLLYTGTASLYVWGKNGRPLETILLLIYSMTSQICYPTCGNSAAPLH